MQKLIMPFKSSMMLCGYKNPQYKAYWGYEHYGVDISTIQGKAGNDHYIYASGEGTVVACGHDSKLGYAIAILYPDVYNHVTGKTEDLIARYMHMEKMYVTEGQRVTQGMRIALEGKEGTADYHLHLEFDKDTKYPVYTPQVARRIGAFWKKGTDTTVNPSHILYRKEGYDTVAPTYNPAWLNSVDFSLPMYEEEKSTDYKAKYEELYMGLIELVNKYKEG